MCYMALKEYSRALSAAYDWRRDLTHAIEKKDGQQLQALQCCYNSLRDWHSGLRGLEQHCHGYRYAQHNVAHRFAGTLVRHQLQFGPDSYMDGSLWCLMFTEWQIFYAASSRDNGVPMMLPEEHSKFVLALFGAVRGGLLRRAAQLLIGMRDVVRCCACCDGRKAGAIFASAMLTAVMPSRRLLRIVYRNTCTARLRTMSAQHMPYALVVGRWQTRFALSRLDLNDRAIAARWLQELTVAAQPPSPAHRMSAHLRVRATAWLCSMLARRFQT